MIGICIITHGEFAEGIKNSVEMIAGETKNLKTLGLFEGQVIEEFQDQAFEMIKQLDHGEGVLVFVDMFGATPFNTLAQIRGRLMDNKIKCGVITGLNLPMLIEATTMRESITLENLLDNIAIAGKESVSTLDLSV